MPSFPRLPRTRWLPVLGAALALGTAVPAGAAPTPPAAPAAAGRTAVCPPQTAPLRARCLTLLQPAPDQAALRAGGGSADAAAPSPYLGATDLQKAYALTPALLASHGRGQTVAVVDAYGYPQAEKDLAVYRAKYGLSPCTRANGCFRQLDQRGRTKPAPPPPAGSEGWQVETALDLDMVSAACPLCDILLVESDSDALTDLGAGVDTAVAARADAVSNSYGAPEQGGLRPYVRHWQHPGVPILASSGDSGFGTPLFPAVIPSSVAVGGTELTRAANARGFTEAAWELAGSGCSAYFRKPAWQPGTHCSMRLTADVSAAADNLIIYNSSVVKGFAAVAGTSASAPFLAGVIGLAGNADSYTAAYSLRHRAALVDVVGGTNAQPGQTCGTDYLCNAVRGYDGPTGLGTPNGIGGF